MPGGTEPLPPVLKFNIETGFSVQCPRFLRHYFCFTYFVCTLKRVFPFSYNHLLIFSLYPLSFGLIPPFNNLKVWFELFLSSLYNIFLGIGLVFLFGKFFGFGFCVILILILFDFYSRFFLQLVSFKY